VALAGNSRKQFGWMLGVLCDSAVLTTVARFSQSQRHHFGDLVDYVSTPACWSVVLLAGTEADAEGDGLVFSVSVDGAAATAVNAAVLPVDAGDDCCNHSANQLLSLLLLQGNPKMGNRNCPCSLGGIRRCLGLARLDRFALGNLATGTGATLDNTVCQ